RLVQDRVHEARWRFDLLHHVHARQQFRQMSDERRATLAIANVCLKRRAVVPRHGVVEVIAEPRFDLFASPDHFRSLLPSHSLLPFLYFVTSLLLYVPIVS